MTSVISCNCKHEYQDSRYGNSKRVHNFKKAGGPRKFPGGGWVCTVCGDVKPASAGTEAK